MWPPRAAGQEGRNVPAVKRAPKGAKEGAKETDKRKSVPLRGKPARKASAPAIELDALNEHLGYFVRRIQVWIFQDFIRRLARIDISPAQFSVLVVISANPGLSQSELAATLGIERARLVRMLHRLERRNLTRPPALLGRRPTPCARADARGPEAAGARPRRWPTNTRPALQRTARRRAASDAARTHAEDLLSSAR